jgi:two-component system phosphate regulon sensor histidine kinase PhoR
MPFQSPSLKSPSPNLIALLCSSALSIPSSLVLLVVEGTGRSALVFFLFNFCLGFVLIRWAFERYINRQIKLIYKLISQTKASKRENFFVKNVLPPKTIDDVRQDAIRWSEHQLNAMNTLEQNDRYRREFLQNLGHELKTPIFSIQGYIDSLLDGAMENPELRFKFLTNADKNVQRLANLVSDLDQIVRLEQGELSINPTSFLIQDLFQEVCEDVELLAKEKQIVCRIKKDCDQPLMVHADAEKIRQVLTNLVDNAIKYGRENGIIEGSFYAIPNQKVMIEITDNGYGISSEHLDRIFERFYRTDAARSRKIGGSGLGLSICKHILDAHQEYIYVRSTPEIGTTFGFALPQSKG